MEATIAEYKYFGRDGREAYFCRYEGIGKKKSFSWKHKLNGKDVVGKGNGQLLPYKYEKWKEAERDSPIFFVESEKSVDDLDARGAVGTCLPGGASSSVKSFVEFFKDRIVYILPDNDLQGKKFCEKNAKFLDDVCKSVKILDLGYDLENALEKGKDIYDWFREDEEKSLEDLLKLAENSPEFTSLQVLPPSQHKSHLLVEEFMEADDFAELLRQDKGSSFWKYYNHYWQPCDWYEVEKNLFKIIKRSSFFKGMAPEGLKNNAKLILKNPLPPLPEEDNSVVPFKDFLVSKKDLLKGELVKIDHSKEKSNQYTLAFNFKPGEVSEVWEKVLNQVIPDLEIQGLLQEIFGYILIGNNDLERFFISIGNGGNGKGVITLVLILLLGKKNCSFLGLDEFKSGTSYSLFQTIGKRVNIVNEVSDVSKANCATLKSLVSGEELVSNRKYKDPITFNPKFTMWISANTFPRFLDKSDGIWRRLILLPFENSFDRAKKRDPLLKDPNFWIEEGNLPGIFNWALEGYRRLLNYEGFTVPEKCEELKAEFRDSLNPMKVFIETYLELDQSSELSSDDVYSRYVIFCEDYGCMKASKATLTQEIKRIFKSVQTSQPKKGVGVKRFRHYLGLRFK